MQLPSFVHVAALLGFLILSHFNSGLIQVLTTPLLLSMSSARFHSLCLSSTLGFVLSFSGTGALFGSVLLAIWGGTKRKIYAVLGCGMVQGLLLGSVAFARSATWVVFVAFSYMCERREEKKVV